jgi:hypothetical protein
MQSRFDQNNASRGRVASGGMPLNGRLAVKAGSPAALRIEAAANSIAVTMIATFVVAFAYLYFKHRVPEGSPASQPAAAVQSAPLPARASAAAAPGSPAEPNLVPVMLRVRYVRQESRLEGSLKNLSAAPLDVILIGTNHEGDETGRVSLRLAPYESRSFGMDDGMELESGGQVLARGEGYQDRQTPIP